MGGWGTQSSDSEQRESSRLLWTR